MSYSPVERTSNAAGQQYNESAGLTEDLGPCPTPPRPISIYSDSDDDSDVASVFSGESDNGVIDVADYLDQDPSHVESFLKTHSEYLEQYLQKNHDFLDNFLTKYTSLLRKHLTNRQKLILECLFRDRALLTQAWDLWPDDLARHLKDKQGFLECLLHDYPKILHTMFHKTSDHAAVYLNLVQGHPDTNMAVHTEYDHFILHSNLKVPYDQRHEIDWMPPPGLGEDKALHEQRLRRYQISEHNRRLAASTAPPRPPRTGGKCNPNVPRARNQRAVNAIPTAPITRPNARTGPRIAANPRARPMTVDDGYGDSTKYGTSAELPHEAVTKTASPSHNPPAPASPVAAAFPAYPAPPGMIDASRTERLVNNQWRLFEQDAAIKHMLEVRDEGNVRGEARFDEVGRRLKLQGIDRNGGAVKNFWNRFGRARSGFDERKNKSAPLSTSHQGKRWATVATKAAPSKVNAAPSKRKAADMEDFAEAETSGDESFRGTPAPKIKKRRNAGGEVVQETRANLQDLDEEVARRVAMGLRY